MENTHRKESFNPSIPRLLGSCRLNVVIMSFLAIFHIMILRFNMSMAIVCMAGPAQENGTNHTNSSQTGEFNWTKQDQSYILSSFFYGYICTQIIGGWLSDWAGGRKGSLAGIAVMAITTLLIPYSARFSFTIVLLIRVLQGLTSGFAVPAFYGLFAQWSHPCERATLMGLTFAAIPAACAVNYPLSSLLCESGVDGGWPMVFYVPGASAMLLTFAFAYLVYDSPETHPRISQEERDYLVNHHAKFNLAKKLSLPWKSILTSKPVYALLITHVCSAWGWYLIAINMPLFAAEVFHVDIVSNGLFSALPFIGMLFLCPTGKLFDHLRQKKVMSLLNLRKIFNSIGFAIPLLCNFSLAIMPNDISHNVPLTVLGLGLACHMVTLTGGFYFSHKDIGGPYSTMLFGMTQTAAQIPGFLNPQLVAWIAKEGTRDEWYSIFYLAGGLYGLGMITYILFGDVHLQAWAKPRETHENKDEEDGGNVLMDGEDLIA